MPIIGPSPIGISIVHALYVKSVGLSSNVPATIIHDYHMVVNRQAAFAIDQLSAVVGVYNSDDGIFSGVNLKRRDRVHFLILASLNAVESLVISYGSTVIEAFTSFTQAADTEFMNHMYSVWSIDTSISANVPDTTWTIGLES